MRLVERTVSAEDEHFALSEVISIMALADTKGLLFSELITRMGSCEYTMERARALIDEAQDKIREFRRAQSTVRGRA